jgi:aminoglycoside phosphotransferase (APT) family kinase protein
VDNDVNGLRRWVQTHYSPDADIVECDKGSSGFSNETWVLTVQYGDIVRKLVLRKPSERIEIAFMPEYDLEFQYDMLKALAATPVLAPTPLEFERDPGYIGTPFYLMENMAPGVGIVPNDGPPSGIHGMGLFFDSSEERRTRLWHGAIDAVVDIHAVEVGKVALPFTRQPRNLRDVVEEQLEQIDQWHRHGSAEPIPALAKASSILRRTVPEQDDIVLCWGDMKLGNLVFVDDAVAGVLDWEMSHLGTPEMDLMYFVITDEVSASSFGLPRLPGCPAEAETLAYYEHRSGRRLRNLEYHRMFQTLRLATLLVLAARAVTLMGMAEYFPENWATNNEPYRKLESLL